MRRLNVELVALLKQAQPGWGYPNKRTTKGKVVDPASRSFVMTPHDAHDRVLGEAEFSGDEAIGPPFLPKAKHLRSQPI